MQLLSQCTKTLNSMHKLSFWYARLVWRKIITQPLHTDGYTGKDEMRGPSVYHWANPDGSLRPFSIIGYACPEILISVCRLCVPFFIFCGPMMIVGFFQFLWHMHYCLWTTFSFLVDQWWIVGLAQFQWHIRASSCAHSTDEFWFCLAIHNFAVKKKEKKRKLCLKRGSY